MSVVASLSRPEAACVFTARGLTKIYRMGEVEVHALRGVDLDIYASEFVVLLGPSGSGKSTLLNILGGLDSATSGEAWFEDHDLTRVADRELTRYRREHVGFVFQLYNLIPSLTALENVALVTEIATRPMDPAAALALVGLDSPARAAHRRSNLRSHAPCLRRATPPKRQRSIDQPSGDNHDRVSTSAVPACVRPGGPIGRGRPPFHDRSRPLATVG